MYTTKMIPLESVLNSVYLLIDDYQVDEDLVNEFAVQALEHLSVYKSYDYAVCVLKVDNYQTDFPRGMLGVEHVLYQVDTVRYPERRFLIRDAITTVTDIDWNTVEYEIRYDARLTNFTSLKNNLMRTGWNYLPLSNRNFDRSILCNPELHTCDNCDDWWYPDKVNNRFITSFPSGYIAVTYYRYPQNSEGKYMIIDMPFVKDAILNYVLSMIYLKFWLAGKEGAESKHKYFNTRWGVYANAAIAESIKPSFDEIINMDKLNTLFKKDSIRKIIGGYGKEIKNMR